ncbi:hypothetical protein MCG98_07820 [Ruminococcus sp. OA3]|uniref:hypothetical protein n=1 Tax=Ruminococcus sp. OA3 TaxID=2914164 RepID=UPI001F061756|nr:hypothetical protein [Ruminococcus sp. OA3]MCH1982471.1 hypothetical protein [Ruminococcus sp. OA3]
MNIMKICNVNVEINTEYKLVNHGGFWCQVTCTENMMKDICDLQRAIKDIIEIFDKNQWFTKLPDYVVVLYSEGNPICLHDDVRIGLHRTDFVFRQDVYQFTHEFTHRCLEQKIPKTYLWFEESICMLITDVCMELLYEKYWKSEPELAKGIKNFQINNFSYNLPVIFECWLKEASDDKCREVQNTISRYLDQFIFGNIHILKDIQKLPAAECKNFSEYLKTWNKYLNAERITLAEAFANVYTMLYQKV